MEGNGSLSSLLGQVGNLTRFLPAGMTDPSTLDDVPCEYFLGDEGTHGLVVLLCLYGLIGPSILFAVLAVALTKRKRVSGSVCCGLGPGVPEPLSLGSVVEKDRVGSVLGLAAAALVTMQVVLGEGAFAWRDEAPTWARSVASLALGLAVGQIYWPVLVSLTHDHPFVSVAGTLYSAALTAVLVLSNLPCKNQITDAPLGNLIMLALKWLPVFLLQLFVTVWIPYRRICAWAGRTSSKGLKKHSVGTEIYQFAHVRHLFNAHKAKGRARKELLDSIITKSFRYANLPGFRFSAVFLSAIWMGFFFIIFMTAEFLEGWLSLSDYIEKSFAFALQPLTNRATNFGYALLTGVQAGAYPAELIPELYRWVNAFRITLLVAMLSTTVLLTLSLLLMLRNYRSHTLLAYQGRLRLPVGEWAPVAVAGNAVRYLGIQYGYIIWAFLIQFLFLFLAAGSVAVAGILVFHYEMYSLLQDFAERAGPVLAYVGLLWAVQRVCLRRWLLGRDEGGESVLGLRNRRAFSNYAYFMTFGSAPLGLFSCAQRVLRATLMGLWLLPRLDVPVMSEGFQRLDPGFPHYASLLRLETTQRNPCLVVFLHFLFQDTHYRICPLHKASEVRPMEERRDNLQKHRRLRVKLVRNRWALLLTLHFNPALRAYRKHNLKPNTKPSPAISSASIDSASNLTPQC